MCQNVGVIQENTMPIHQTLLTEANLRLHSIEQYETSQSYHALTHDHPAGTPPPSWIPQYNNDLTRSEDGQSDVGLDDAALRKAASLEALQAYGGCFASGFLAMQNPLPWAPAKPRHSRRSRRSQDDADTWTNGMESVETGSLATASTCSSTDSGNPRPDSMTLCTAEVQDMLSTRKSHWRTMKWRNTGTKLQKKRPVA